jgi:hypothetical protein
MRCGSAAYPFAARDLDANWTEATPPGDPKPAVATLLRRQGTAGRRHSQTYVANLQRGTIVIAPSCPHNRTIKETKMKIYGPGLALALLIGGAVGPASAAEEPSQFQTSVPSDALTISNYYDQDVYDSQNNKIGDVKDILLDKEGRVSAVIVGVGGVLGIGEKDVAALKFAEKDGDRYLVMNTSKEALEKAPGYTYDRTKGVWVPAKQPT